MQRLGSPSKTRRLHTNSESHLASGSAIFRINRPRLNTLQDEAEMYERKPSFSTKKIKPLLAPLSPPKYYETKLTLSSETWAVYNAHEQRYKRGWKPNKIVQFNGLIRLMLIRSLLQLMDKHHSLHDLRVRINRYLLREQHRKVGLSLKELQKLKSQQKLKKPNDIILAENTTILYKDLIVSTILIHSQQLLEYSVIFMGKTIQALQQTPQKQLPDLLLLQNFEQGVAAIQQFTAYSNLQLKESKFNSSSLTDNFQFFSTPNQLGQIVADMLRTYPQFQKLLEKKEIATVIRYQVGYQFYQDRLKRFMNERPQIPQHLVLSFRGKFNFGVISYNKSTNNVVVLNDCKFSMAEVDISRVQNWLASTSRPKLVDQSKLMPLLRLLQ